LHRRAYEGALALPILSYLIIAVANNGLILLVNGSLDFTASKRHVVKVVGKRYVPGGGKSSPKHLVAVTDWTTPREHVVLEVGQGRHCRASVGSSLEIETGCGLLGIEWIKSVRPL
jgi:hypothetical protein